MVKGERIKLYDYYDAIKTIKIIEKHFLLLLLLLLFTKIDFMLLSTIIITGQFDA
jgi:hypothetical protein